MILAELVEELKASLTPETWCQGSGAYDKDGKSVPIRSIGDMMYDKPVRFCLYARVVLLRDEKAFGVLMPHLLLKLREYDSGCNLIEFNDTHTLEEIHAFLETC